MTPDDYLRIYEKGALDALDHITDLRPDLEDLTMEVAERVGRDIAEMEAKGLV